MIPGRDNEGPALFRHFKLGGASIDVGTGVTPVIDVGDLTDSAEPPFRTITLASNHAAAVGVFSYFYFGLPGTIQQSARLLVRRIKVFQTDANHLVKWGIETFGAGILRTFTTTVTLGAANPDATSVDVQPGTVSFPNLRTPLYAIRGGDATDIWTAIGVGDRFFWAQQNLTTIIDTPIILKPGAFFFLQSFAVNEPLGVQADLRLYD